MAVPILSAVCHATGNLLIWRDLVRPSGFEPPTFCSGGKRSIQLSYGRTPEKPATPLYRTPSSRIRRVMVPCFCRPISSPERWLSGRKQRFAKPSYGLKLYRGFESPPLRQSHIIKDLQGTTTAAVGRLRSQKWQIGTQNSGFRRFTSLSRLGFLQGFPQNGIHPARRNRAAAPLWPPAARTPPGPPGYGTTVKRGNYGGWISRLPHLGKCPRYHSPRTARRRCRRGRARWRGPPGGSPR